MGFNVKELENLSAEEKVKVLMDRLKEYETLKCSEKNCDSDLSDGKWTIYKNRKLCSKCYKKEYDKDKQPDMDLIVKHYIRKLKSVTIINDAKSKINMTEQEFQNLIKPFKTANIEKLENMRVITEHYIIARIAQHSITSLKDKHNMSKGEYEGLIEPFKLEYESKPKKVTISRTLAEQDNTQLNTQNTIKEVKNSTLESESNNEAQSTQKKAQTQEQKEANTPKKESKPHTQQHKEETTSVTRDESDKQKKNQNQPSSIDQVKEKVVQLKDPISASSKEKQQETQNSTTQFVAEVNSKIVYGEKEKINEALEQNVDVSPLEENKSTEDDYSLFQLEPENTGDGEHSEYNQDYASTDISNFQGFQDIEQSPVSHTNSQAEDAEKPKINFTGVSGFEL